MTMTRKLSRRTVLRGALSTGAVVSLGLPLLDCFLDTNGILLAASGAPIPTRFATWMWGCGMNPVRFFPKKVGRDFEYPEELKPLERFKDSVSVFSGYKATMDGAPNTPHV